MKKISAVIFPLFVGLSVVCAQGESIEDYFPENKLWSVYDETGDEGFGYGYSWETYLHYVKGEKEIDGKVWKQFYRANKEDKSDERPCFLLLQEGQKVYKDTITNLIFDFGAQKGDIIWKDYRYDWGSLALEGIQIDSVYYRSFMEERPPRKCLDVSLRYYTFDENDTIEVPYKQYFSDTWVEGFGSLRMGGLNPGKFMINGRNSSHLLCVHQNGEQEYQNKNFKTCYVPAPKRGLFKGRVVLADKPQPWQDLGEKKVFALVVDSELYFLRTYNCFFWGTETSGYHCSNQVKSLASGDGVEVDGYLSTRQDTAGNPFKHLLVQDIRLLSTASVEDVEIPNKKELNTVSLYPNPTTEEITVNSALCPIQQVEILNTTGQLCHTFNVPNTNTFTCNVSGLTKGLSFARVKTACGTETLKFIVE